jgi:hypothetical protein
MAALMLLEKKKGILINRYERTEIKDGDICIWNHRKSFFNILRKDKKGKLEKLFFHYFPHEKNDKPSVNYYIDFHDEEQIDFFIALFTLGSAGLTFNRINNSAYKHAFVFNRTNV